MEVDELDEVVEALVVLELLEVVLELVFDVVDSLEVDEVEVEVEVDVQVGEMRKVLGPHGCQSVVGL